MPYWQKETYNKQLMSDEQIKTFNSNNNKLITIVAIIFLSEILNKFFANITKKKTGMK